MFAIDFRECQGWNDDSIAQFQQKDEHLSVLLDWVRRGSRPPLKRLESPAKRSILLVYLWRNHSQRFLFVSKACRLNDD